MYDDFIFSKRLYDVYDCEGYTTAEILSYFYKKINDFAEKLDEIEGTTQERLDYLLGEGLSIEVAKVILQMYEDGRLSEILNNVVMEQINNKIDFISYNFLFYGGKNDGVTDNREKLQNLIDRISLNGGGTIYFPKGTYYFSCKPGENFSVILKSNVSLKGINKGLTILKCGTGNDENLFTLFYQLDEEINNCKYSDMTIDLSNMNNSSYTAYGKAFYMQGLKNCVFRDLELIGTPSTGLGADYLINCVIDNVTCENCGRLWTPQTYTSGGVQREFPGGAGIGIGTGKYENESFKIINCHCNNCGHYGIFTEHQNLYDLTDENSFISKNVIISKNTVTNGRGYGIGVRGGRDFIICDNIITNNALDGININSGEYGSVNDFMLCKNIKIDNNMSLGNRNGFTLGDRTRCEDISITNNVLNNNVNYGVAIDLYKTASRYKKGITISYNEIKNNGSDIYILNDNNTTNVKIFENIIDNKKSTAKCNLSSSGVFIGHSNIFSNITNNFSMIMKVNSNIVNATSRHCLISNRDESYITNDKPKGFSILISKDKKLIVTYSDTNGNENTTIQFNEDFPINKKVKLNMSFNSSGITAQYTTNGHEYFNMTTSSTFNYSSFASAILSVSMNNRLTIGREYKGNSGYMNHANDLIIYNLKTSSDSISNETYEFKPFNYNYEKITEYNGKGYELLPMRNVKFYLDDKIENIDF